MVSQHGSLITSANAIDISKYSVMHVEAYMTTYNQYSSINIATSRIPSDTINYASITTVGQWVEYTLDISMATSAYLMFLSQIENVKIRKIWLT